MEDLSKVKKVHKSMGRPKKNLEAEERAKREIANCNERRRMESINNGFSCLRQILRQHNNIDKHSKAAILCQSADYIKKLEQDINKFTAQNQMLKNFIDNYGKQRADQQHSNTKECEDEKVIEEEDTEDEAYVPPKKKNKLLPDVINPEPSGSQSTGNHTLNKRSVLQNSQELTQIFEKQVFEFKLLLERERLLRAETHKKQNVENGSGSNRCTPVIGVSPLGFPIKRFPNNNTTNVPPIPLVVDYPNNYKDQPLNLVTTKNSSKGFPMNSIQYSSYQLSGQHTYNTSMNLRPQCLSSTLSAKIDHPQTQFNKQEYETHIKPKNFYKNPHRNHSVSDVIPFQIEENESSPIPLIKDMSATTSTKTNVQQKPNTDTQQTMFSSSANRSRIDFKENFDLIIKEIQPIEGEHRGPTLQPTSVLKHILSEDYRNNNK